MANADQQSRWRLRLGLGLLIASIAAPIAGVPLAAMLGLRSALMASVTGAVLASGEVLGIVAIAVMGKPGYMLIKERLVAVLRRHGPPQVVSRLRYRVGLCLFCAPLLAGWLAPYAEAVWPGLDMDALWLAIAGDLTFLVSLFVLGGDFWDKLRGLFIHSAKISAYEELRTDETAGA